MLKNSQLLNFILLLLVSLSRKEKAPSTNCAKAMRRQHSMKGADILIFLCFSVRMTVSLTAAISIKSIKQKTNPRAFASARICMAEMERFELSRRFPDLLP